MSEKLGVSMAKEYNDASIVQGDAMRHSFSVLERFLPLLPELPSPICVADVGSAQGKNSCELIKEVLRLLRTRFSKHCFSVSHTDLPWNDWCALFELLEQKNSYTRENESSDPTVFASAVGTSMYRQMFPPNSQHLILSTYTSHWLEFPVSQVEIDDNENTRVKEAAADGWAKMLKNRATELAPGGLLVYVNTFGGRGITEHIFNPTWKRVMAELLASGTITQEEVEATFSRTRFAIGRSKEEQTYVPAGVPLKVVHFVEVQKELFGDMDNKTKAKYITMFTRAWADGFLVKALKNRTPAEARAIANEFWTKFESMMAFGVDATELRLDNAVLVLQKIAPESEKAAPAPVLAATAPVAVPPEPPRRKNTEPPKPPPEPENKSAERVATLEQRILALEQRLSKLEVTAAPTPALQALEQRLSKLEVAAAPAPALTVTPVETTPASPAASPTPASPAAQKKEKRKVSFFR